MNKLINVSLNNAIQYIKIEINNFIYAKSTTLPNNIKYCHRFKNSIFHYGKKIII